MKSLKYKVVLRIWMLLGFMVLFTGCPAPQVPPAETVGLEIIVSGLASPVAMAIPDDETNRKFIVDQTGKIFILDANNNLLQTPFLDVSGELVPLSPIYDERGLLALAFHPDYATNGRFFIKYNAPKGSDIDEDFDSELRISEFTVSPSDPNLADPASERILLTIPKPQANHNGGTILFGPDGFLYIGVGDGGGAGDNDIGHNPETGNGQDKTTLLGKVLRIDVDNGTPYGIPVDNPFVGQEPNRPEIWAYGFRNPYSFSFDAGGTNQMFLGDVGQELFEEIDIVTQGGNYGWRIREGANCFNPDTPTDPPEACPVVGADGETLIDPILEYAQVDPEGNAAGRAVIGGYVYRGSAISGLNGNYIFGDLSTSPIIPDGSVFAATQQTDGTWTSRQIGFSGTNNNRLGRFLKGFAQDQQGELYLLTSGTVGPSGATGEVLKIVPAQ